MGLRSIRAARHVAAEEQRLQAGILKSQQTITRQTLTIASQTDRSVEARGLQSLAEQRALLTIEMDAARAKALTSAAGAFLSLAMAASVLSGAIARRWRERQEGGLGPLEGVAVGIAARGPESPGVSAAPRRDRGRTEPGRHDQRQMARAPGRERGAGKGPPAVSAAKPVAPSSPALNQQALERWRDDGTAKPLPGHPLTRLLQLAERATLRQLTRGELRANADLFTPEERVALEGLLDAELGAEFAGRLPTPRLGERLTAKLGQELHGERPEAWHRQWRRLQDLGDEARKLQVATAAALEGDPAARGTQRAARARFEDTAMPDLDGGHPLATWDRGFRAFLWEGAMGLQATVLLTAGTALKLAATLLFSWRQEQDEVDSRMRLLAEVMRFQREREGQAAQYGYGGGPTSSRR